MRAFGLGRARTFLAEFEVPAEPNYDSYVSRQFSPPLSRAASAAGACGRRHGLAYIVREEGLEVVVSGVRVFSVVGMRIFTVITGLSVTGVGV